MQISDKELHANLAKMERGIPVMLNGKINVVVDLSGGEQTTAWFTLEELKRHLTKRALDSAPPYTAEELDIITDPRRNGALQEPPSQ